MTDWRREAEQPGNTLDPRSAAWHRILAMPVIRNVDLRSDAREPAFWRYTTGKINRAAILGYSRGHEADHPCEKCRRGAGLTAKCVTVTSDRVEFQGACTNCAYGAEGSSCSFRDHDGELGAETSRGSQRQSHGVDLTDQSQQPEYHQAITSSGTPTNAVGHNPYVEPYTDPTVRAALRAPFHLGDWVAYYGINPPARMIGHLSEMSEADRALAWHHAVALIANIGVVNAASGNQDGPPHPQPTSDSNDSESRAGDLGGEGGAGQ